MYCTQAATLCGQAPLYVQYFAHAAPGWRLLPHCTPSAISQTSVVRGEARRAVLGFPLELSLESTGAPQGAPPPPPTPTPPTHSLVPRLAPRHHSPSPSQPLLSRIASLRTHSPPPTPPPPPIMCGRCAATSNTLLLGNESRRLRPPLRPRLRPRAPRRAVGRVNARVQRVVPRPLAHRRPAAWPNASSWQRQIRSLSA